MAIEIFWGSGSPYAWRVLLAAEIKRVPYESKLISFAKGENRTAEFLAMSPRGKVPALRDGGFVVSESLAILAYLERRFPEPAIFGRTAEEHALVWRAVSEYDSYLNGPIDRLIRPLYFGGAAEKADDVRAAAKTIRDELQQLEAALTRAPFLAGEAITAADIVAFPGIQSIQRAAAKPEAAPLDLALLPIDRSWPRLAAWQKRIEAIPGYDRTYPPHWR